MGIWEGSLGCEFLRGSICAEGMGCGRRWVKWVLRGTGTASGHPGPELVWVCCAGVFDTGVTMAWRQSSGIWGVWRERLKMRESVGVM